MPGTHGDCKWHMNDSINILLNLYKIVNALMWLDNLPASILMCVCVRACVRACVRVCVQLCIFLKNILSQVVLAGKQGDCQHVDSEELSQCLLDIHKVTYNCSKSVVPSLI